MSSLQPRPHSFTDGIVRIFLDSHLALVLILIAVALGAAALWITPREEDPQIIVPMADVYVSFPGHSAAEVEQLVAVPLEKLLYQIDGVEHVYSMSRPDQAIITVRFYVGQDRERSLVKLYARMDEHVDIVPPGVASWVIKPVEIDDVPIVTFTLKGRDGHSRTSEAQAPGPDEYTLRRVGEEIAQRLAALENISRAYVVGGPARTVHLYLDPDRLRAYSLSPLEVRQAVSAAGVTRTSGEFTRHDEVLRVEARGAFASPHELDGVVVGVSGGRPVLLEDVATIVDGPAETTSFVRFGWGPGAGFAPEPGAPGSQRDARGEIDPSAGVSQPAVTIALAKKKGTNAVVVAETILKAADELQRDVVPDDMELIVTRNYGLTADHKVNELVEALAVAVLIVIALLTLSLGWREALIVAVAVPVVFGLTLAVNLLAGYTINRVTLFALILALGLLVDDPIVDVENITRHFTLRRRATRQMVLEAVSEIRPPLITATLAVIVSFLPMLFITGMMGPYMRPMALNVPVAMLMSMVVAFTITPWLSYHVLRRHYGKRDQGIEGSRDQGGEGSRDQGSEGTGHKGDAGGVGSTDEVTDLETLRRSRLYRLFYPLMAPLLHSRRAAWGFLGVMGLLMLGAALLAAVRAVPLKMLPFDNKNELLLVLDFDEGTTLERADAAVRETEQYLAGVPEVTDFTSYVGLASPIDFNGLVRHYYLRRGENVAEIRVNLVGKRHRESQSHALGLRMRDAVTAIADRHHAALKIVETPPGPPVLSTIVAEVYGRPDHPYEELIAAAQTAAERLRREPFVVDVDGVIEAPQQKFAFVSDKEKAALHGVSAAQIADVLSLALAGSDAGVIQLRGERNPLRISLRWPEPLRSSLPDLSALHVRDMAGGMVPLSELGRWETTRVDQTIYHKDLERVVYVYADTAGRAPAEAIVDIQADRVPAAEGASVAASAGAPRGSGGVAGTSTPAGGRTFLASGGEVSWWVPDGIRVDFAGEGEWQITLDVFRDLGLAFAAALIAIYVLLVAQTGSFAIPGVVMLAIPLTVIGIMPGFWLLNLWAGGQVGPYADPIFFTATGMIGMIALAGIVTRDAIILVDFIHLSLRRGRSLFDAIMESRVVRLRPILLTAGAAMLGAAPITIDPIFSGLAWALIFGLFASTVFTLFVIPVTYWLIYARRPGHGLPVAAD